MSAPIRIHPENPEMLEFRGHPLALLTATEHYGAVINRPFCFERYLADAAEKKITLTRLFTLFRELQSTVNSYSTRKPESPDFIAPYRWVGPGTALDGQPVYDLDQPNPEFFDRLLFKAVYSHFFGLHHNSRHRKEPNARLLTIAPTSCSCRANLTARRR